MSTFAERLKYLRKTRGITQLELGRYLGYRYNAISNYETAAHEPDYYTLMKIAEYFDVSVDFLIGHDDCMERIECIPDEIRLLQMYRKMSLEEKEVVFRLIEVINKKESNSC